MYVRLFPLTHPVHSEGRGWHGFVASMHGRGHWGREYVTWATCLALEPLKSRETGVNSILALVMRTRASITKFLASYVRVAVASEQTYGVVRGYQGRGGASMKMLALYVSYRCKGERRYFWCGRTHAQTVSKEGHHSNHRHRHRQQMRENKWFSFSRVAFSCFPSLRRLDHDSSMSEAVFISSVPTYQFAARLSHKSDGGCGISTPLLRASGHIDIYERRERREGGKRGNEVRAKPPNRERGICFLYLSALFS